MAKIFSQRILKIQKKQAYHDFRLEKWNYKRQAYYVPVPPPLSTEGYLVLPKTWQTFQFPTRGPKLTLATPLQTRTTASALFALKGPPSLCWWTARCTHKSSSRICLVDLCHAVTITTDVGAEGKRTKNLLARGVPPTPTEQTRVNRLVAPPAPAATADPGIGVAMNAQAIEV